MVGRKRQEHIKVVLMKNEGIVSSRKGSKLENIVPIIKECCCAKFDESVDIAVNLNINVKKSDQAIRGIVSLPYGSGRKKKILAICASGDEEKCIAAGAEYAGAEEYIDKISQGFLDFDVVVTVPTMMIKLGKISRILGPKGLMPNPKTGTVAKDIELAIKNIAQGQIEYRSDSTGIIHNSIGRASFDSTKIIENVKAFVDNLIKTRPQNVKGNFIKSISLSSTMGPSFFVDLRSI